MLLPRRQAATSDAFVASERTDNALPGAVSGVGERRNLATRGNAALHGGAMNEPAGERRRDQRADVAAARGRAEQKHPRRIAAERGNISLDPVQHRDLVEAP